MKETSIIIIISVLVVVMILSLLSFQVQPEPIRTKCEQIEYEIKNARRTQHLQIALQKKQIAILQGKCLD